MKARKLNVKDVLDQEAYKTLFRFKWPDGFVCPRCSHTRFYRIRTRKLPLYQCRTCQHQTSLTAGTIMEGTRTPLSKWITAISMITRNSHKGTTAIELMHTIQVTYKTAWSMLHKIRQAMTKADNATPLTGDTRAGLLFYCWPYPSPSCRFPFRSPVFIAAEVDAALRPTRLKLKYVSQPLMIDARLSRFGEKYLLHHHIHPSSPKPTVAKLVHFNKFPHVRDSFWPVRRWINITFHGIGPKYLQAYLDEYCFQYNCTFQQIEPTTTLLPLCMTTRRVPMKYYDPRVLLSVRGIDPLYDHRFEKVSLLA